jgi:hypothetical protein
MFDREHLILNATAFHRQVVLALNDYCGELTNPLGPWPIRKHFDDKMQVVIKNCG